MTTSTTTTTTTTMTTYEGEVHCVPDEEEVPVVQDDTLCKTKKDYNQL